MNKVLSIILLTAFFFFSCEKELKDSEFPKVPSKLVVGCFISPQDTVLSVYLTESSPIGTVTDHSSGPKILRNAKVILSSTKGSIELAFNEETDNYEANAALMPIESGRTYFLNVTSADGRVASGQCIIPPINTNLTVSIDSVASPSYNQTSYEYKPSASFIDNSGEKNYYRLYGQSTVFDTTMNQVNRHPFIFNNAERLLNDDGKDGNTFGPYVASVMPYYGTVQALEVLLLSVDSHYYNYYTSVETSTQYDPFSEPENIYSNIEGGLGVFAAYQIYRLRIK